MHPLLLELLNQINALDALIDQTRPSEGKGLKDLLEGLRLDVSTVAEREPEPVAGLPHLRAKFKATAEIVLAAVAATERGRPVLADLLSGGVLHSILGDMKFSSSLPGDQNSDPDPDDLPPRRPKS